MLLYNKDYVLQNQGKHFNLFSGVRVLIKSTKYFLTNVVESYRNGTRFLLLNKWASKSCFVEKNCNNNKKKSIKYVL